VADCLSDQIAEQDTASEKSGEVVSDQCREEVFSFKIERSTNINKNIPLGEPPRQPGGRRARSPGC
jgi:Golgi apparatus protein 1